MELEGRIKMIGDTKAFGANGFRKREFVITTQEQYPQHIMIETTQDKCDIIDKYNIGDIVKVSININGREWVNPEGETKYFNSIQMWRIEKISGNTIEQRKEIHDSAPMLNNEPDHDLPF